MSDNLDTNVQLTADAQQVDAEIKRLENRLQMLIGTFQKLDVKVDSSVGNISKGFEQAARGAASTSDLQQKAQAVQRLTKEYERLLKVVAQFGTLNPTGGGRGTFEAGISDAVAKNQIREVNSTPTAVVSRIAAAEHSAAKREMKTSQDALVADWNKFIFAQRQLLQSSTNEMLAARQRAADTATRRAMNPQYQSALTTLDGRREAETIRRASMSDGDYQAEKRMQFVSHRGGADLLAIQTRLLVGYQALSMAFNTAKSLSTFIVQLDKEFKQFQAITNTTSEEMIQVRKELIAVSEATKFSALEVAQAATVLGQAGMSARNVREAIGAITLLATAAGSDLNSAVETVTSTLSIFNLQADQATQISNTFTAALNGSKLSMDKITLGLQYAGNTAAQFGVTYQELTSILGAMANSGIKSGSTLGTGLRQLLVDLEVPTKKFAKELEKVGLTQADVDVKSKGLVTVLQNLKNAGFGAANAYGAFEVRAAAAYSAIINNLDLATSLNDSFYQSTAALKANSVQMESLANTWDKFKSVVDTLAYNTFAPFITVLQKTVDMAANLFSTLNQFPGILEVVGAGFASITTALAASTAVVVGKGLFGGLPIIASSVSKFKEIGAAASAAGVGMNAFSVAAKAVGMALRAHWITAAIAAAAGLATLVMAFRNGATELERRLASLDAMASQTRQSVDTYSQEISAVDQTISNLQERKAALDADPIQRKLKIDEVLAQFGELNNKIDSSTSSVADLVSALEGLREMDFARQIAELSHLESTLKLARETEQQKLIEEANPRGFTRSVQGQLQELYRSMGADVSMGMFGGSREQRILKASPQDLAPFIAQFLQESMYADTVGQDLSAVIKGGLNPEGARDVEGFLTSVENLKSISKQLRGDSYKLKGDELEKVTGIISLLDAMVEAISPTAESVARQEAAAREGTRAANQRQKVALTSAVSQQLAKAGPDTATFNEGVIALNAIINDPTNTAEQVTTAVEDLKAWVEGFQQVIDDTAKAITVEGFNPSDVQAAANADKIMTDASSAMAEARAKLEATQSKLAPEIEKQEKVELKAAEDRLAAVKKRVKQADNLGALTALEDDLNAAYDQVAQQQQEYYESKIAKADDRIEADRMRDEQASEAQKLADAKELELQQLKADRLKIEEERRDQIVNGLNTEIQRVQKELDDAIAELKKEDSGVGVASLKDKIASLMSQLHGLFDLRVGAMGQSSAGPSFYSALFRQESGGNFDARHSGGAAGRAQFIPARWEVVSRAMAAAQQGKQAHTAAAHHSGRAVRGVR